jgi:hypothetical protein
VEIRQKAKKQKRVLIYAKLDAEKISSIFCQGISKEQKKNFDVCQAECRKMKCGRLPRD